LNFKKLLFFIITVSLSLLVFSVTAFAYDIPENVRVGLEYRYKEVESIEIGNKEIAIGYEHRDELETEVELEGEEFVFELYDDELIDTEEYFDTYEDALDYCEEIYDEYDYEAVPVYMSEYAWGVYVYDFDRDDIDEAIDNMGGEEVDSDNLFVLLDEGKEIMFFDGIYPQIEALDNKGIIKLYQRSYRGRLEIGRYNLKKLTAVNVVSFEEYLYGVVASEMPSQWDIEAIKAQAVAARSYALTRIMANAHKNSGYELCDGTNCQVYIGYGNEKDRTTEAVEETEGELALYDGQPINAVFFSSSGGSTDNSENVWSSKVPYLRAVPEINETAPEWKRTFTSEELGELLADKGYDIGEIESIEVITGEYGRVQELIFEGEDGTKSFEKDEVKTFCSASSGGSLQSRMFSINEELPEYGDVEYDDEDEENEDEKVTYSEIYVYTEDGRELVEAKSLRVIDEYEDISRIEDSFYVITSEGKEKFEIEEIKEEKKSSSKKKEYEVEDVYEGGVYYSENGKFTFYGRGNGHGVGMSQYGAKGMAEAGYDYEEILEHYYTGITVR